VEAKVYGAEPGNFAGINRNVLAFENFFLRFELSLLEARIFDLLEVV